ncbi:MAG: hypothetical protein V7L29_08160 [Nostoc sp.]|uniref:hypothetical protein n=1 Tax=Nostoc sp. TaxID=1180 RepID=UPI002FF5464D
MRLFTICPNTGSYSYIPTDGISLNLVAGVPCLTLGCYAWCSSAQQPKDPSVNILPVTLTESTKKEIQAKVNTLRQYYLKYATLHNSSHGFSFLKEEDTCNNEQDVVVSLELPLSAAQPYYEFEGDIDVVLGAYAKYYNESYEVEKENILCSAIIKMRDGAKLSFTYTNRYGQGIVIKEMMGQKFRFVCSNGHLLRLDDYKFQDFKLS